MTNIESSCNYECKHCNYITMRKSQYDRHLSTAKHQIRTNTNLIVPTSYKVYRCECEKIFKHASSLWNHKQKCDGLIRPQSLARPPEISNPLDSSLDSSLVLELLKQNQEFKEMMIEQHKQIQEQNKQIIDLAKTSGNTTNNTNNTINNNNNKFNLNVFLNETCKDAINLNDFIQSIELTIRDFVNTGEVGYVKGISDIMLERIRDMEPHVRPIHCTDLKRETVYVKDSDIWAKEDANNTHIRKAVRIVANKNKEQIHSWIQENPNYDVLDTPECDKFFEYSKASLGGYGREEDSRFENKIISNILTETTIDKKLLE